ncbi:MAG: acyl-CoA thioesterase [Chloroflexi bacterium]|nr:acyl-CoA thioesterase [Chloroflexota bacterium]
MTDADVRATAVSQSEDRIVLAQVMLPADANPSGDVHGGTLMKLADTAGGIAAARHAKRRVVTAIADSMTFEVPVKVGDLVLLEAQVTWVGRTSMEIEVAIFAEKIVTGERKRASLSYFVYVALGPDGRPHEVTPLELHTDAERERFARAEHRRQFRLAQRSHPSS